MEDNEKIESLEKEIEELEKRKEEKDKLNELFKKRNQLKYAKLVSFGSFMKRIGKNVGEWADEKNKELEEEKKEGEEEVTEEKPVDAYDALFGENELTKNLGF